MVRIDRLIVLSAVELAEELVVKNRQGEIEPNLSD